MSPIVIVPGLGGSGEAHWQTHLEWSLSGAIRIHQDDWHKPELPRWLQSLAQTVEVRPGAILVAHSLGCPLVAHLAAQRPDLDVAGALLVAPADVDSAKHTPSETRGFAPIPLAPLPFHTLVVASTNDPFMTFERARTLAGAWGADLIDAGPSGHINVDSGFGPWPEARGLVDILVQRVERHPRTVRWAPSVAARGR
jgi:predicted alpha/beta hydrolase family esterase